MLATCEKAKLEKSFPVMLGSLADRAVQKKNRLFFFLFFFLFQILWVVYLKDLYIYILQFTSIEHQ